MDASGMEFSYLEDAEREFPELVRNNRMALYGEHIKNGGSAELSSEEQENLGKKALSFAEVGIDLLASDRKVADDDRAS